MNTSAIILTLQSAINSFSMVLRGGTLPNLGRWDYLLLALLSVLQGPVATLLGATAAAAGLVRPGWVFVSISSANLTVDIFWFSIGRAGKIDWLLGSNRLFKVPRARVEKIRKIIVDQSSMVMAMAKITSGFVMPTMIATGLARVPWKRWLPPLVAVELLRTGALLAVGYYSARTLSQVLKGFSFLTVFGSLAFVLVSAWFIRRALKLGDKLEQPPD